MLTSLYQVVILSDWQEHWFLGLYSDLQQTPNWSAHLLNFVLMMQALTSSSLSMTLFGPVKLRCALLTAGNIVKPSEISEVLSYVTKDGKYQGLDGLHLILLKNGSVQQIEWDSSGSKKYFVFTDAKSKSIYSLMEGNKHQLVESSSAWGTLSM